ncbi:hypothetical protein MEU_02164 [Candida albicans P37005]|nr:hypothetical protein MEU_02164 [Candida albicans P37005]
MKFGLPDNFEVVVDVSSKPANQITLSLIKPSRPKNTFNDVFKKTCNDIDENTLDFIKFKQNEINERVDTLQSKMKSREAQADINITHLIQDFNSQLRIQNEQVEELIRKEKERIRLELERKRREEEERRRREEEERRRQEEEERRRKEEEERKRKEEAKRLEEEERKRKEEEEARKKREAELKRQQELKIQREKELLEQKKKERESRFTTDYNQIEKTLYKYKQDIQDIKNNVKLKLNEDPDLKKQVNQYKRKINPKFGQLSNSLSQFNKISTEVIGMIKAVETNALVFKWVLNFTAKAIIDQAETEVIVRPNSAVPLAKLAYAILQAIPDFEYYLNARFIKKCPYIIGYNCSIDSEEGRERMGWKRPDGSKWEEETKYDERMGGIVSVWAAMTTITNHGSQKSLYSFEASWQFLARTANLQTSMLVNTHFTILGNWWEAAGASFLGVYGNQSQKLMYIVVVQLTDVVASKKFPSAARLRIMGEEWVTRRQIQSLKAMEY